MIDQSALFKANQEITIFNLVAPTIQFMLPMILLPQVREKKTVLLQCSHIWRFITCKLSQVFVTLLSVRLGLKYSQSSPSKNDSMIYLYKYKLAQWKVITEIIRPFNTWIKGHDVRIVSSTLDVDWCKM